MKVWLLALLTLLTPGKWGMDYYIEANVKNVCGTKLMGGTYALSREFSDFFAAASAYDDKSEVMQVERILKVDLSTFQTYDSVDENGRIKTHWKDIRAFNKVLNNLLNKIKAHPSYYKKVKYNPIAADNIFTSDSSGIKQVPFDQQAYEDHPLHGYPNDWRYLKSGQLVKDVKDLKAILGCYMRSGATKIRLTYM
ncbi:hypothetical protein [Mucilaginibacter terrae]|uniref:mRNA-degrading endonuclease YafQ of YafQ-DinJ toxin-antitoxin module n=1 Tax=Mucilaginibacter terrae TaxID=1955052 RepID=A0ABU3GWM8_9SPHI|nr:hypothetical protein [Mucilaginibacter terrae]MDT3403070.1 mRNA-degrading endonuclease YafQ of YafQ-DinJ toxin-antitoxin module [Mucilaginibacter terrae]